LTINEIKNDSVNLTISTTPINLILMIGEEKRLNLTSPEYYDLYIRLNSINITENSANLTVKSIYEYIDKSIFARITRLYRAVEIFIKKYYIWIVITVGVIILIIINDIIEYWIIKRRERKRRKENVRIKNPKPEKYKRYIIRK